MKAQVKVGRLGKQHAVDETDRNRWPQLDIIFSFAQLLAVQHSPIVQDTGREDVRRTHLHFNIILPAEGIASLDVQDRPFSVECFFFVEGIENLKINDPLRRLVSRPH